MMLEKMRAMKHKKLWVIVMTAFMAVSTLAVGVSAADGTTGGVSADLDSFITTIKGALSDFTTANLGKILVAALGLTVGLGIAWFAYRFLKNKIMAALKKGKVG